MNRMWSLLELKSVDDETRTFSCIATTPSTDRMDDIVDPKGATFSLPLPILMQHGKVNKDPVGWVRAAEVTDAGIKVSVEIAKLDAPASLKDDVDRAWALVKSGLIRGLSIGFAPLKSEPIKGSFGQRFTKWDWMELSLVSVPANQDATILNVKAADMEKPSRQVVFLREKGVSVGYVASPVPSDKRKDGVVYL